MFNRPSCAAFCPLLLCIVAMTLCQGCSPFNSVPLAKGQLAYESKSFTESQARTVAEHLSKSKFFEANGGEVKLTKENQRMVLEFNLTESPKLYGDTKECRKLGVAIAKLFQPEGPVDIRVKNEVSTKDIFVRYEPIRAELPLTHETRGSILGGSIVLRVKNTSDRILQVQAYSTDRSVGTTSNSLLELPPGRWIERGWAEGTTFHSGDEVVFSHPDFESMTIKIN